MSKKFFPPQKVIYDQKYLLRPVVFDDVSKINSAYKHSLPELRKFMNWAHEEPNEEVLLERIVQQNVNYFACSEYELALFDLETGDFYVYIGFYPSNRLNDRCFEIGYWTSSLHSGKGLGTTATRCAIALLFEYFHADRVEVTCSHLNLASLRIIEKCGFHFEGALRNFYPKPTPNMLEGGMIADRSVNMYSLLPEDRKELSWYSDILEATQVYPLLGEPFLLKTRFGKGR